MPFIIPNIDNVFWKMACQPYRYANQTWMVHYSNKTKQNIDSKIMSSLLNCMHDIYECTTRLLVVRLDLHPKVYSECNTIVSMFYRKLVIALKRLYPKICFSYAWCREHDRSYRQHYHCAIFIDANIMNHPHTLLSIARKLWVEVSMGAFYTPKGCYYDVHNTDNKNLMLMVYRMVIPPFLAEVISRIRSCVEYAASVCSHATPYSDVRYYKTIAIEWHSSAIHPVM